MRVNAAPKGLRTITPYFSVLDGARFIEFLKQAFDAKDTYVATMPDGTLLSAEVQVGDSIVVIGEDDTEQPPDKLMRAQLYMYVENVDAVYQKAMQAGAKSISKPADQFWGDRSGIVEDMAGNQWWHATHKEDMSSEELVRRAVRGAG